MKTDIAKIIEYCTGIAAEFEGRLNRIRSFVPNHNPTSGTANEIILRNFLSRLSAGRFKVGQGFICDPINPTVVSKQCDIIVYDFDKYPLVYSEGEIKVVFPQSVKMVIEVKTQLDKKDLKKSLQNISSAKETDSSIHGIIFAFGSAKPKTIIEHLKNFSCAHSISNLPIAILLFNEGVIIHRWPVAESGHGY